MSKSASIEYAKQYNWGYLIAEEYPKLGQQLALALINSSSTEDGLLHGLLAGLSRYYKVKSSFSELLTDFQLLSNTPSQSSEL